MNIQILGTRAKVKPSAPGHEKHTGFLINEELLIDVGEEEFLKPSLKGIVFTHFHPDHAFFEYEQEYFKPDIPLFGPEKNDLIPNLNVIVEGFELMGYKFTPVPVIHALNLKSLGYLVEKEGKKVLITGDVAWIEKKYLQQLPQVDLVITEATILQKGGRINRQDNKIYGHTGIPDLIRILSPLTKKILFTHYGDWFLEDPKAGLEKFTVLAPEGVELIPSHDGFEIEI